MKELLNKVSEWLIQSWDKIATLAASAAVGSGILMVLGDSSLLFEGALAGLAGRLIAHVQVRI